MKHKKSPAAIEKRLRKAEKKNQMEVDEGKNDETASTEPKVKADRKKVVYKKFNYSITGKNGPRAVHG